MISTEKKCKQLLTEHSVDIYSEIDFDVNDEIHTLSFIYIIDTFMLASDESQKVFSLALEKALKTKEVKIENFFESMGQLLLMTQLSTKI